MNATIKKWHLSSRFWASYKRSHTHLSHPSPHKSSVSHSLPYSIHLTQPKKPKPELCSRDTERRKKMSVLDSHVEALAFNYFNYVLLTILNNLWTWVALITAALSFWRIRSTGCPKPRPVDPTRFVADPVTEHLATDAVTTNEGAELRQTLTAVGNGVAEDVDGVRKGKFTVYYEEEDTQCRGGGENEGHLTVTEGWGGEREGCESEWWEGLLRLRNGEDENGWYTWQDLTELNGNVVRLWDGGLRFGGNGSFTSETWYSSSWTRG